MNKTMLFLLLAVIAVVAVAVNHLWLSPAG
jgi:hypothetical protein